MPRKFAPPKKRPYGHGSVSLERGHYVANYTSLETGRQVRKWFLTDKEAQEHLDLWYADKLEHKASRERGEAVRRRVPERPAAELQDLTFAELLVAWRAFKTGSVRATTWRSYGPALNALTHYLGDRQVNALTEDHFVRYRQARLRGLDWKTRKKIRPLKPTTINAHLDRAHTAFEWAINSKPPLASDNPVRRLVARGQKLKVEKYHPVVVDAETIDRLIDAADPAHQLEIVLMGHLALRWGEAMGVGVGHVKDGQVLIRQQVIENREVTPARMEISTYGGKTDYARRDLYASERILAATQDAYQRLGGPNPFRLLRPTRTGAPYRENNWLRIVWRPTLKEAGLEDSGLTPHGLRHSRLSLMAKTGKVTPGDLRRFAGHHDVAFTLARYGDHFSSAAIPPEIYLAS